LQGPDRALAAILHVAAAIQQRKLNVLDGTGSRKQVEILKNEPNLLIADLRKTVAVKIPYLRAVQAITARSRLIQTPEYVHERRFT
jgi:hypothetical protein